jgi:polyisoprenoid-binding protein YceI
MKKLSLLLALVASSAMAAKQEWALDTSHSSINFGVDHMVISETTGKFDQYSVEAKADKPDFTDAEFKVVIQTKSINTADAKRDEHLKNKDFFDVENKPTITFIGNKFEKTKSGAYKVHGDLTMNGVTKKVILDGKFNGIVKDPWGGTRAGLKITGELDRYEYGLKYNSVLEAGGLAIGQKVRIAANVELIKK